MAEDKVHKPSLPGVKTFAKDVLREESDLGVSFGEPKETPETPNTMHVPEKTVKTGKNTGALDVSSAFEGGLGGGAIITDKKKHRSSVGGVMKSAFNEWFGNIKSKVESLEMFEEEVKPTMAPVEKRKEVIAEAAQHTKLAPKDDHTVVVEKLKTREQEAPTVAPVQPILVKEKQAPAAPTWTHTLDARPEEPIKPVQSSPTKSTVGIRDFRAEDTKKESAALPKRDPIARIPAPIAEPVAKKTPATPKNKPESQQMAGLFKGATTASVSATTKQHIEAAAKASPHKDAPASHDFFTIQKSHEKAERPAPQDAHRASATTTVPFTGVALNKPAKNARAKEEEEQAPSALHFHLKRQHIIMLSVVVTLGALFSFGAYYLALLPAESELMESEPVPSFFATDVQTPIHLPKDRSQFMSSLHEAVVRAQGRSVQLYPIVSSLQNTHVDVATAEEVLGVISPGLSGAFLRSLENEIMLGTIETTTREPFIIIRSFNFDTAFAGMLSWEPTMAADLSPFFDLRSLLEEGTETGIAPGASGFVDATRQNRSIRILYDKDSNERLIYAFVSRDTIVITESTDALAAIIDRL